MVCVLDADDAFGPQVHGCRDDFDFTLVFEQSLFQIAPCAILLLSIPGRATYLLKQNTKVLRTSITPIKQAALVLLACTQLALFLLWSLKPTYRTRTSIPAATVSTLASLALLFLSSVEHSRSIKPSAIINTYMFFSLLLDIPQARTLWLRPGPRSLPATFTVALAVKAFILWLEAKSKRRFLKAPNRVYAPEMLINLYDRTMLWWLTPIFRLGFGNVISFADLYPVDAGLASETLDIDFQKTWAQRACKGRYSLLWALVLHARLAVLEFMVPRLVLSAFKLSQPLFISRVTSILGEEVTDENLNSGRGMIGAAALIYCGLATSNVLYKRQLQRFQTKLRGTLVAALYRKVLVMPSDTLADNAAITLINTDVQRIIVSLQRVDDMFATPIEIAIAIFLLNRQIGVSCIAPVVLAVCISTISFLTSNNGIAYQKKWLAAVSDRIAYTASVLYFPKGFKMLGLTHYFIDRIQALRVKELDDYAQYRKFATYRNVFGAVPGTFAPPMTLMMYTLLNGGASLDSTRAFTTLALVALLTGPVEQLIHAVPLFQTALASVDRIQAFLQLEGLPDIKLNQGGEATPKGNGGADQLELTTVIRRPVLQEGAVLELQDASVRLGKDRKQVLSDFNLTITAKSLTLVVGPVGCGKTTLLRVLIGDLQLARGQKLIDRKNAEMSYCAQEPWLPNASSREIVTGPSELDETWFDTVIRACALHIDIASFSNGADTVVGTKGLSLSGGQCQRLALARAVYSRRSMVVVDDALSGLDASTSRYVFERVFGKNGLCSLHGMTVVIASSSAQYADLVDSVILMKDGQVVEQGLRRQFDDLRDLEHEPRNRSYDDTVRSSSSSEIDDAAARQSKTSNAPQKPNNTAIARDDQHDLARRTGDITVYRYYARSIGWAFGTVLIVTTVFSTFGLKFGDVWVRWWAEPDDENHFSLPMGWWIGIYLMLATVSIASESAQLWAFLVWTVPRSSGKLHRLLLEAVMRAPHSFFVKTDAGVTLNRFSSDMTMVEIDLAGSVLQTFGYGAVTIASAALIVAGSKYAAAMIPLILPVIYLLQKFYLRTSRQIRFMDIETQAPLIAHCQESLSGGATIRAFGWQKQSHAKCLRLLDDSQRASYIMFCIQRWLNLVLDMLTAGIAVTVVALAMELRATSSASSIGVSLVNLLGFNQTLTSLIAAWTMMETSLGAVARIKNFEADTASEDLPGEVQTPPPTWPERGALEFKHVYAAYRPGNDVLRDINLSIPAGSKVGICGRSGSGKSSLLLALLRLLDTSGEIVLDGVSLAKVPRQRIREAITALPQEALIFPGSLRENLDPQARFPDSALLAALERVGLHLTVTAAGGLDIPIAELALSHGQVQLFSVARAILRPSKVLVLDEVTSSVDRDTETAILDALHESFRHSTVIAVAHRLETIMDCDTVVVMSSGCVVEAGRPRDLFEKEGGRFRSLAQK